jgi:hypothetical protein
MEEGHYVCRCTPMWNSFAVLRFAAATPVSSDRLDDRWGVGSLVLGQGGVGDDSEV